MRGYITKETPKKQARESKQIEICGFKILQTFKYDQFYDRIRGTL
jgi:hypothetical protein